MKALPIFKFSVDYNRIKVHNEAANLFQANGYAITPNGEIYFNPTDYKSDFSIDVDSMAWLIHEMTHCWQHQHGMWVRTRSMLYHFYQYGDLSSSTKSFLSYGVEQQASIVADYYLLINKKKPQSGKGSLADYERVIPFMDDKF